MLAKLRHPGVIIAVIALIAAIGGTAVAAGGLSGAEKTLIKKESEKAAKKFAKAGPQGAPGAPGAKGTDGINGKDGTAGANGKSVEVVAGAAGCGAAGGNTVQVAGEPGTAQEVCNGSPWAAGGTLPSGATETGAIAGDSLSSETPAVVRTDVPISFTIPLAAALDNEHVLVIYENAAVPSACENPNHPDPASAANPEASSGYLCVYLASDTSESATHTVHVASATSDEGASTAGANLVLIGGEAGWPFHGTWAVTG